ncbi:MAG: insulinase family protein [Pseudomonadales bacterium]|nr:insulinase family protein [Pseudomonadales bacterium]
MPTSKPSSNARFSRKTLNIIIVMTSLMVLMFLNLPGGKKPEEAKTSDPTPLTEGESAALFANSNSNANATAHNQKLQSLDIIASKPVKNHRIDIQSWNTSKGAKVLFVESHEVPMLDIRLVFNAGSARDDALPGVANFVNAMLNEGTENFSVDQIAEKFEGLGANFGNGAYRDMAIASLRTLSDSDYRDKALPLFYEVVTKPAFPETSMERIRKQLLIALEHKKQRPSSTASEAFFKTLYADHPYGSPSDGTETSLKKIDQQALLNFHQQYYTASNMVVAIVGDIDKATAQTIGKQLDRALPQGTPAPRIATPHKLTANQQHIIDFPSTQSHLLVGNTSIKRSDPQRFALSVGNEILGGGGFSSRLNQVIRQDHGLAYSVYSYFSPMAVEGPFIMGLQTKNEQRQQALDLMKQTLQEFIGKGPSDDELNHAKQNIINSFPLGVASNSSVVGHLGAIGFYDLPLDYLDTYLSNIEKVTAADIRNAFENIVNANQLLTIVVGPETVTSKQD